MMYQVQERPKKSYWEREFSEWDSRPDWEKVNSYSDKADADDAARICAARPKNHGYEYRVIKLQSVPKGAHKATPPPQRNE